ncbi:hypothetical protein JSY17_16410 [Pseudomonas capsici]|uniref:hypothetical protein n=1 Tax=Pseudomonas capsici TaxID=2810614 RepID=UPI0019D098A0|nr:hypothetical protein [Pseudomonas capsici]MBN6715579.1 hypothetical protein [Pseudomonas capsici]MBN6720704.1 hypothetical protein [Pseudomonas capsici]MBN6725546.1 hypothetical protein [Pseudomonas capsici]
MDIPYLPLLLWNKHWKLSGESVSCQYCGRSQHLADHRTFKHAQSCPQFTRQVQSPGRELGLIIEQKINAGLF